VDSDRGFWFFEIEITNKCKSEIKTHGKKKQSSNNILEGEASDDPGRDN
jgi:hypothetical protein